MSAAQYGGKHPSAKPWKGEGPGTLEIARDFAGDTYRAIYTVRFRCAVYELHVFQKKSSHGIATRQSDVNMVRDRLKIDRMKIAARHYEENYG